MIVVYFTAADEKEARKISEKLVKERLAACANYFPVKSIYWWEGKVQKGREVAVLLKSEEKLFGKIVKRIRELNSYELPVIEKIDVEAYPELERWIKENTK